MSRVYVGNRVQSVDIGEELQKISRVVIAVDSDHVYTAGDDTGRTIERECPWGSQEMADALLEKLSGVAYKPFSAERAMLSPAFEIGDAVTVGGVYSQIVGADINYSVSGLVDIYAPDLDVIEDEYPAEKTQQSSINRELAKTRSSITKTAEQIRLEVANEIEGLSSSVTIELDGIRQEVRGAEDAISYLEVDLEAITGRVQDAEGNIGELELTAKEFGVRIEDAEGGIAALELTTEEMRSEISGKIDGKSAQTLIDQTVEKITLEASSEDGSSTFTLKVGETVLNTQELMLSVDAAYITGQLVIGKQLPSDLATTSDIPTRVSELYNDEGYETERGITSIIDGMVTTDYVNALGVTARQVSASGVTAGTLEASWLTLNGLMRVTNGSASGYIGANNAKGGAVIADDTASVYCIATSVAAKISYYDDKMIWVAEGGCYSNETMQVYSDRTLKNSIDYDLNTEAALFAKLRPCAFVYNSDENRKKHWGFIAQDLIAGAEEIGVDAGGLAVLGQYGGKHSIAYGEITALNTLMIQKLMERVDDIESKLEG